MKAFFFSSIIIALTTTIGFAQLPNDEKRGNNWIVGYRQKPETQNFLPQFNFNSGSLQIDSFFPVSSWPLSKNSTISDKNGELKLLFTGCSLLNKSGQAIKNGENMIPDSIIWQLYCPDYYPLPQTLLLLPDPGNDTLYYSVMSGARYQDNVGFSTYGLYLSHLSEHEVLEKNVQLFPFNVFSGHLAACRHANGRDWWVVVNKLTTNEYYKYLIGPGGVQGPFVQKIGNISSRRSSGSGQAVFSADGTRYLRFSDTDDLLVFDFDRCSGELSNFLHVDVPGNEQLFPLNSGLAVSPNSRYAYTFCGKYAYQLDLEVSDIAASLTLIGEWDGTLVNGIWATYFNVAALAPDGKIYSTGPGSIPYLHIVHQPDLPAPYCQFEQHALLLPDPVWNGSAMPLLPDYHMGPMKGSPCDTLTLDTDTTVNKDYFRLGPNPNTGAFQVSWQSARRVHTIVVYDALGRRLYRKYVNDSESLQVDLGAQVPAGVYFVVAYDDFEQVLWKGKVVVQR